MKGVHIMIAGMAYQVFSLALFMILWGEFALRASRAPSEKRNARFEKLQSSFKFKAFQAGKSKNLSLLFFLLLSLKS
jgi:RTA1 like protein